MYGQAMSPANENVCGARQTCFRRTVPVVMEWTLEDGRRGRTTMTGYLVFDARRYAVWLGIIEKLDTPFDSAGCFA